MNKKRNEMLNKDLSSIIERRILPITNWGHSLIGKLIFIKS